MILESAQDPLTLLQLSYYSNQFAMFFSSESFLAHTLLYMSGYSKLTHTDIHGEEEFLPQAMKMTDLVSTSELLFSVFRNEFLANVVFPQSTKHYLDFA